LGFGFTFSTRFVVIKAYAGKHGNGAIEESDDSGKRDILRLFDQIVASTFSLFASQHPSFFELEQDILQKLM
jgi:hypothetical protein